MAGLIALLLWSGGGIAPAALGVAFLLLWTLYAFISGVVAVPYNDIVGRAIPSGSRSRMLAWRFFGGGLFALVVAAFVRLTLDILPNLQAYALIFGLAALLMLVSSTLFVSAGEPPMTARTTGRKAPQDVRSFLRGGWRVLKTDSRFRLFLLSQWLGGATLMSLPFYVIAADANGVTMADVGLLLGAQTAGALASNPIWGRLGDGAGKLRMLQAVALLRIVPPLLVLLLLAFSSGLLGYLALFVVIGAMMNGVTIGYLGYLMEISPKRSVSNRTISRPLSGRPCD